MSDIKDRDAQRTAQKQQSLEGGQCCASWTGYCLLREVSHHSPGEQSIPVPFEVQAHCAPPIEQPKKELSWMRGSSIRSLNRSAKSFLIPVLIHASEI
jgi:hypothetical protein